MLFAKQTTCEWRLDHLARQSENEILLAPDLKSVLTPAQHVANPCAWNTAKPASHAMNEPKIQVLSCELRSNFYFRLPHPFFCSLYFFVTVLCFILHALANKILQTWQYFLHNAVAIDKKMTVKSMQLLNYPKQCCLIKFENKKMKAIFISNKTTNFIFWTLTLTLIQNIRKFVTL